MSKVEDECPFCSDGNCKVTDITDSKELIKCSVCNKQFERKDVLLHLHPEYFDKSKKSKKRGKSNGK